MFHRSPTEPPPSHVVFPDPSRAGSREILAVGVDFSPGTLLAAYRQGIFPWPQSRTLVPWCSPDPRAIFPLESEPHWSRSLRRTLRKSPFRVSVDEAFGQVIRACGEERDGGTWIVPELVEGYERYADQFVELLREFNDAPSGGPTGRGRRAQTTGARYLSLIHI